MTATAVSHPRRSEFHLRFFPGLPAWANVSRANGAGAARVCSNNSDMRTFAMRIRKALYLMLLGGSLFLGGKEVLGAQSAARITGTYTNMYYNKEGGDVLGEELKIVVKQGGGYQGALQFAEGEPQNLIVVEIKVVGSKINFSVPDSDPYAC